MRLDWLEDILAVAEAGSFTEAARRRHLTQSAFSRRIRAIEEALEVELFDRTRKPVQLHPSIREQKDQIAALIVGLRQLMSDLRRGDRSGGDRVVIASQHALTASLAPSLVAKVGELGEGIRVRLRSANLDECFAMLLSRQAEIALAYRLPNEDHPINTDYIETSAIGSDLLIPVVAAGSVADVKKRLDHSELQYIAYPGDVFFGQVMNRNVLSHLRGINHLVVKAETALTLAALELASVGVAVAWAPASLANERIRDRKLADLSGLLPSCALDVTAVRLLRSAGRVEAQVWKCLTQQPLGQHFQQSPGSKIA